MSTLFFRTLRENPADAEVPSHRLLVRAGYIRRAAPGAYSWLPLGLAVLRNVENVVRRHMDAAGFQEVLFPGLLPREPYERTGRWTEYGDDLFRLVDRKGADMLLGPTHEEMFTLTAADILSSYKDLPLALYQIQWKFRDELRPRAGLLRGREFLMKDSYSFDLDDAGLDESYRRHRAAYIAIFDELGLDYTIVSAMSGAMGGSKSEEFLAACDVGEDTYVTNDSGTYAANVEAVTTVAPPAQAYSDAPAAHVEDTPGTPTIDSLVAHANNVESLRRADRPWQAADTLKNVLVTVRYHDGTTEPLAVGVPGDREVDVKRLAAAVAPGTPEPFGEEEFAAYPMLVKGYIGPGVLGSESASGIRYLLDPRVVEGTPWITGADEPGRHVFDLVCGRDFQADGTIEAAEVRQGDPSPDGEGTLVAARGIEIGHIFQLGRKYADALGLKVLDNNGKQVVVTMGSYGIGVSRLVAAIAEQYHDDQGLRWPAVVAPADVHLVIAAKDEASRAGAETIAEALDEAGVRVLLDDRKGVSPGVKFTDAELIGLPLVLVVGRRFTEGYVELRDRATSERNDIATADAVAEVRKILLAAQRPRSN